MVVWEGGRDGDVRGLAGLGLGGRRGLGDAAFLERYSIGDSVDVKVGFEKKVSFCFGGTSQKFGRHEKQQQSLN